MEQIVYCQDQAYRAALQKIREKESKEEKKGSSHELTPSLADPLTCSLSEILQHLMAYRLVSARVSKRCFLSHFLT